MSSLLRQIRRKAILAVGVTAVSVLAVACAGAPQLGATTGGFQASVGGFSFSVPPVTIPFISPPAKATNAQTTTTTSSELQGAVHSGEGCPLALPQ